MATAAVTPDQDAVTAEIFIAAPPERVFQAITDPSQLSRWWGQAGVYRITERTADLRPGGKWSTIGEGADGTKFSVEGEYLEIDPPRRLVHTWIASYMGTQRTVVYWDLEPQTGGFTDHRIRDGADFEAHRVYIHENPVKRGLVERPEDYRLCSAYPGFKLDEPTSAAKAGVA